MQNIFEVEQVKHKYISGETKENATQHAFYRSGLVPEAILVLHDSGVLEHLQAYLYKP